ncbi:MAG: uracil phosphoribosyltransferase [Myxococcota bacterium]|nr:uracil phosphoribosyltransferase [Myxococcota bacterium]
MTAPYQLSEALHHYGKHVHILNDPFLTTQLARLCSAEVTQPLFNELIRVLYTSMIRTVINAEFPREFVAMDTRMKALTDAGVYRGEIIARETPSVVVDIARAGILPSQICYDTLNSILNPSAVRQDHLIMARTVDDHQQVTGASISGSKIGGKIEDCMVLFPDPMGATGNSLRTAIQSYLSGELGRPRAIFTLNLIITPEFIRTMTDALPEVPIYALRIDRGMSDPEVLGSAPGLHWERESGLNEQQYIVPGGGGFGELMNNSWI